MNSLHSYLENLIKIKNQIDNNSLHSYLENLIKTKNQIDNNSFQDDQSIIKGIIEYQKEQIIQENKNIEKRILTVLLYELANTIFSKSSNNFEWTNLVAKNKKGEEKATGVAIEEIINDMPNNSLLTGNEHWKLYSEALFVWFMLVERKEDLQKPKDFLYQELNQSEILNEHKKNISTCKVVNYPSKKNIPMLFESKHILWLVVGLFFILIFISIINWNSLTDTIATISVG